jgi:hypothetical protein
MQLLFANLIERWREWSRSRAERDALKFHQRWAREFPEKKDLFSLPGNRREQR